jgi:hypothetical protein
VNVPIDDEFSLKILKSCRSILPMISHRNVVPGEVMTVDVRSNYAEFPEKMSFDQATSGCFEVDEVALRPWRRPLLVLQSRDRGDRTDLASVDALLRRVIIPACVDLALTVRNLGSAPQRFVCGVVSHISVVEWRERLLLSEATARRIEATLARCADGSPRRDLREALGLEDPFTRIRHVPSLAHLPPGFGWDPYPDT